MKIYFHTPIMDIPPYGRMPARAAVAAYRVLWAAFAAVALMSPVPALQWTGVLAALVWAHNAIVRNRSRHPLLRVVADGTYNADDYLNEAARSILVNAQTRAELSEKKPVDQFLLTELKKSRRFVTLLKRTQITPNDFFADAANMPDAPRGTESTVFSDGLARAFAFCRSVSLNEIPPEALVLALTGSTILAPLWTKYKITEALVHSALLMTIFAPRVAAKASIQSVAVFKPALVRGRMINRSWTSLPTRTLNQYGEDLTALATAGEVGYLIGHEDELALTLNTLSRDAKNNVLLVGEPGVGKRTIVWNIADLINQDRAPQKLFDKRIVMLNLAEIFGRPPGEGEAVLNAIVEEVIRTRDVILFLPDLETLVAKPNTPGLSALAPILRSGSIPLIAAVDLASFQRFFSANPALIENFEVVKVQEISEDDAAKMVALDALVDEKRYRVMITARAVERCVFLGRTFLRPKMLPSSATDLLAEAVNAIAGEPNAMVTDEFVDALVSKKVGIPVRTVTQEESSVLLHLEDLIHQRLIDQEEAVRQVSEAIRTYRAGLGRKKGTIGTFLFVGPTGVGKTELAKALAAIYFGGEENMLRFDMSKYQEKQTVSSFIGSPDGAVVGQFTEAVRLKPYSLILLDEFEKANPDILDLFLPVFDEGVVADALGRRTDFKNSVIICTSNAHSTFIKDSIEKGIPIADITAQLKTKLTDYFKPELLNRFDGVVAFKPLAPDDVQRIARLQLKEVQNLMSDKGITLAITDAAVAQLAAEGYDPVFGARTLGRVINERLRDRLAEKLLAKEFSAGDTVRVDYANNTFAFNKSD